MISLRSFIKIDETKLPSGEAVAIERKLYFWKIECNKAILWLMGTFLQKLFVVNKQISKILILINPHFHIFSFSH